MTQPTMTADLDSTESDNRSRASPAAAPATNCWRRWRRFDRVVLVSHVNPDPDSLASMLGVQALLESASPASPSSSRSTA